MKRRNPFFSAYSHWNHGRNLPTGKLTAEYANSRPNPMAANAKRKPEILPSSGLFTIPPAVSICRPE